jgi:hypothetical protein
MERANDTKTALKAYTLPETCCGVELSWKEGASVSYHFKRADCKSCQTKYEQNLGSMQLYVQRLGYDAFKHEGCGATIMTTRVAHSILERVSDAGWGSCFYEEVPSCPVHEEQPSFYGEPVYYSPVVAGKDGAIDSFESSNIFTADGRLIGNDLY